MDVQHQVNGYIQHVEARLVDLEFTPPEKREQLLIQMKDSLIQAETLIKGSGSWLMACLHGKMNEPEMCLRWLQRACKKRQPARKIRSGVHRPSETVSAGSVVHRIPEYHRRRVKADYAFDALSPDASSSPEEAASEN